MKVFSALILLAMQSGAAATGGAAAAKSPVEKVVQLLEELHANLARDEKVEQQIYDRYACWCETRAGSKAGAIHLANSHIVVLSQKVLELKGTVAVLAKEISDLSEQIAVNEKTQKDATAVRQKENGDWQKEKGELEEAINALERAIKVLSGAGTKTGLLQGGNAERVYARHKAMVSVRSVISALPMSNNLAPKKLAAIESFVQELEEPTAADASASYAPASATVQGILKDMYDTFTSDLESQTVTEAKSQRDFEDLIATLIKELNTMNALVLKKEAEKAEASQELADTVQELDDEKATMEADIEFFDQMKAGCLAKKEEWDARSSGRQEEMKGIKEALEILTSDDARALFASAIKPGMETSFLQLADDSSSNAATKAYNTLKAHATKAHSLRLAALAATVREMGPGHFDKVIKMIDEMMQTLKDEEQDDIKQRDWCKTEYQENSEEKAEIKWLIKNNDAMIVKFEKIIAGLVEEIALTVEEIEQTEAQIKSMEDTRKEENEEFKAAKAEDEAAIGLLTKTVEVLGAYYKKNKIEMGPVQGAGRFLQEPEFEVSQWQAPDATFSDKGARKNESKGIISILTMLIEDLDSEVKNGIKDEVAAQAEFEKQLDAAKKLLETLNARKVDLEEQKETTEGKKDDEEADKASNQEDLATNEKYFNKIQPDCDWMLNSFQERRDKRKAEMNGLVTAKEYLTGAAPPAMVQSSAPFDDNKLDRIGFDSLRR